MKQKKAGIIQEAHGIYEAAQIAATKCYATDEDEFKKQSIFKYNYTLPADFPYKKTNNKSSWKSVWFFNELWTKRAWQVS